MPLTALCEFDSFDYMENTKVSKRSGIGWRVPVEHVEDGFVPIALVPEEHHVTEEEFQLRCEWWMHSQFIE